MTGKRFLHDRESNTADGGRPARVNRRRSHTVKPGLHDLAYVFSKNYWILLITAAYFLITIPFLTAGLPGDSIFNIEVTHDQLKFRLIHDSYLPVVLAGAVVLGMIGGIVSFRFLQDKKETTIFFSLGLTRMRLFANRCVSGLVMLFAGIAVPLLVSMGLNIRALGMYDGLVRDTFYLMAGLTVTAAVSFFAAVIVSALAGTLAEAIVCWCGVMASPYAVCFALNMLMKKLFWGNAWGVVTYSGSEAIRPDLVTRFAWLDPLTFFYEELQTHSQYLRPLAEPIVPSVEPGRLIGWSMAAAAMLVLSVILIRKRKAEAAGIAGTNRFLSEWLIAVTSFFAFALIFSFLYTFSPGLGIVLGIAGFAVVHLFWRKALFSCGIRGLGKGLSLAAGVAVSLLICGAFDSGGFQSIRRYLDSGQAVQVSVSYVGSPAYLYETASGSSTGRGYYLTAQLTLEDENAIALVQEIQKGFIESGRQALATDEDEFAQTVIPYDITFTYTDADGTEHVWYYDRASFDQLEQLLSLEDTSAVKEGVNGLFAGTNESASTVWANEAYQNGDVYLTNIWCSQTYALDLSDEQRQELLAAIGADRAEQETEEFYFPEEQAVAVLMFSRNGEYDCEYYAFNLDNSFVYVNARDTHTIAWLEQYGLYDLIDADVEIESITLQEFDPYIGMDGLSDPFGVYFMSYRADSLDDFMIQKDFGKKNTITDASRIAALVPGLRNGYFMSGGGYLAAVKVAGTDGYIYMFLPAEYATDVDQTGVTA
ncbi:MAG: hypothetical protein LUG27_11410 [Clostridiales bacterium]|nr:hypothetical protein [Clostridiales bacterium]